MSTRLFPRLLVAPEQSFFLFGPRGTGKSTWVRTQFPDAHRIDLLDEALYQSYLARIGSFADERQIPLETVGRIEITHGSAILGHVARRLRRANDARVKASRYTDVMP